MSKSHKTRAEKVGLPPGSLTQDPASGKPVSEISLIHYTDQFLEERTIHNIEECYPYQDKEGVTWVNIDGVKHVEVMEKIGNLYHLHPLLLEDIASGDQRPKLDDYDDYLFIVVKMLDYDKINQDIITEQVSFVLGKNYVLSFQEEDMQGDLFTPNRIRLRANKGKSRRLGPDYLMYSLLDTIVDNYFVILEQIGERLEEMEIRLITNPSPSLLHSIYKLKRDIIYLRKSVWPLREVINKLERGESSLIKDSTKIYIRDVYDHTIQVIDNIESFRDVLSGMLDIYLSSISNRMNSVIKVLTMISTIFIPLTFIVGVYGMNFKKNFPEIDSEYGYPGVWMVMILITVGMIFYFRKKKWL